MCRKMSMFHGKDNIFWAYKSVREIPKGERAICWDLQKKF